MTKEEIKNFLISNRIIVNGCWILSTQKSKNYHYYVNIGVHRLSALVFLGFKPESGLQVLHKCDNPPCWNPDHLFIGTQSDNRMDSIAKGRSPRLFGNALREKNLIHCPHGHEYSLENTAKNSRGRICKTCRRIKDQERNKGRVYVNGIRLRKTQLVKRGLV